MDGPQSVTRSTKLEKKQQVKFFASFFFLRLVSHRGLVLWTTGHDTYCFHLYQVDVSRMIRSHTCVYGFHSVVSPLPLEHEDTS